jgi:hypothetical protein
MMEVQVQNQSQLLHFIIGLAIQGTIFVLVLCLLRFLAKLNWLTAVCCAVIAVAMLSIFGIDIGADMSWISLLPAVVCLMILIVQFLLWLMRAPADSKVNAEERQRILEMVEQGKISPAESSELLEALGKSSALRGEEKFSRPDIVILIAVALVVLGFFLPWLYLGRGRYQSGNQAGAIGWAVLIIAVTSAVPIFITPRNMLYKVSMLQIFLMLIGIALVISLLVRAGSHLGPGLIVCLVGFIVGLIAVAGKYKRLAA